MNTLKISSLSVSYTNKVILDNIEVQFNSGNIYTIRGASGNGKSTFIRSIASIIPFKGNITLNNTDINLIPPSDYRKKVHYLHQEPVMLGTIVIDNFTFYNKLNKNKKLEIEKDKLNNYLEMFHFTQNILNADIANLSGGEKQRLCMIRSLLIKPLFLLLDEPSSALDNENEKIMMNILNSIKSETGIIIVSHSKNISDFSDIKLHMEYGKLNQAK